MKRVGVLALLCLLSACVSAQNAPPVAAVEKVSCPTDAAEAWQQYLRAIPDIGTEAARPHLHCAVAGGHVQAMTALGTELTGKGSTKGDFERGIVHLRKAAVAGEERAQRLLAYRYQAGENWIGRNAYLALFWYGVANRDDPYYLAAPKTGGFLEEFRDLLSEQSQERLSQQIRKWLPGDQEPQNYVIDIVMTHVPMSGSSISAHKAAFETRRAIEYGLKSGMPDAALLALTGHFSQTPGDIRIHLLDELVAQGSFLALVLKLESLKGQSGSEKEVASVSLRSFSRLGLDVRYLNEHLFAEIEQFWESQDIDRLMLSIQQSTAPERQILATIAAMGACNDESVGFCEQAKKRLTPFVSKPAIDYLEFASAYRDCSSSTFVFRCMLNNGGTAALRDIIINDTIDISGRSV